jgi:predicted permease
MLLGIVHDVRFAFRSLAKSPLLTGVAVVSLALGIGANTAIFTLLDQVLLRMLPVEDPASLVMVATRGSYSGSNRGRNALSYPMYKDYRERNQVFDGILCRYGEVVNLGFGNATERAEAELVSGNYFEVLGVAPSRGRVFSMDDETAPGADNVVVLNYDYWQNHFSADEGIIGEAIRVNGYPMTVVGVAAPGFQGVTLGFRPKLHIPVTMKRQVTPSWDDLENRRSRWLQVFARLKTGMSREQAEASMRTLYKQIITMEVEDPYFANIRAAHKERFLQSRAVVLPGGQGDSYMRSSLETPLIILMGFVGLVLFITCANVSNLLVAKATNRRKEIALRLAIGAGRRHILQQLLVESFLLALMGGLLALLVGYLTSRGLILLAPSEEQRLALSATPDTRILGFNLLISVIAAFGFGLIPALQAVGTDLVSTIKQQSTPTSAGQGTRIRKALVVVQVVVALLLLVGSGLFVQSLRKLHDVDPGFRATNLVRFKLDATLGGYDNARTKAFYARLQERLQALPGVESAGLAVIAIMENNGWDSTITVEGYRSADDENMNPHFNSISPDYFETLDMAIKQGRDFDSRDMDGAKPVVVVNETFAARYFENESPLGYHLGFGGGPNVIPDMEIVGVVEDAKYRNLRDEVPRQVFVHYRQSEWATEMTFYVRTSLASDAIFAAIRREVENLDATMPIFDMNTMEDQLDRSLAVESLIAYLSSAFGILAAVLAFVGLYGVTSFGVSRRTSEIGLRMALGARGSSVIRMVLKEVLILTGVGIAVALPSIWWLSKLLESQLYGVATRDPVTISVSAVFLFAVTILAGSVPAVRASRLSPTTVLRYE